NHDSGDRLFGNLGAPAGFTAGIIAFALFETEFFQKSDEIGEMLARAAEGMMIVIAPAQPETILPLFLEPGRAIELLPIVTLGFEKELAGKVASDEVHRTREDSIGRLDALRIAFGMPRPRTPQLFCFDDVRAFALPQWRWNETSVRAAFDRFEPCAILFRD